MKILLIWREWTRPGLGEVIYVSVLAVFLNLDLHLGSRFALQKVFGGNSAKEMP